MLTKEKNSPLFLEAPQELSTGLNNSFPLVRKHFSPGPNARPGRKRTPVGGRQSYRFKTYTDAPSGGTRPKANGSGPQTEA